MLKVHLTEREIFPLIARTVGSHWSSETSGKKKKNNKNTPAPCCFHSNRSITATQQLIRISMNFKCSPCGAYIGCRLNRNIDRLWSTTPSHNFWTFFVFIAHKTFDCQDAWARNIIFIRMEMDYSYFLKYWGIFILTFTCFIFLPNQEDINLLVAFDVASQS